MKKKDIRQYNNKGQAHGYCEVYHYWNSLYYKGFYHDGNPIGYEEFYHPSTDKLIKRFYII
jgi:hypothetical protein